MLTLDRFQVFLDGISDCFVNREYLAWENRIVLPFSMVTSSGTVKLSTSKELRQNFEHYLTACSNLKIDAIVRKPVELERCEDGSLIGTYDTELLSTSKRVSEPYRSNAILHCKGEETRMSSILNAKGHHAWTGVFPKVENASDISFGSPVKIADLYKSVT